MVALMRVIVVGGGVSGLGSALVLARQGHDVTVVERDDTPMPSSADEAFDWDRRGAPQVRHSHAFLARLVGLLRRDYADIYAQLLHEGATEMRFGDDIPDTITNFERMPDDDELVMLACRRTTFEWVLRRAAVAEGRVTFRTGVGVDGLLTTDSAEGPVPHITGVHLADGATIEGDLTVVAAGRRSALSEWLLAAGAAPVAEEVDDTGIVYFSRFYRLLPGAEYPPRTGPIGGDLGYLKYGVFVGDNQTFSVTLATPTNDDELRKMLADPAVFDACARQLVATAPWLDGRAEPITEQVHVMAGLLNRWRDHVVGGLPVATGVLPVGDAVLCTNPLYGRGCSTAFWSAHLMADAVAAHPDDPAAMALAYDSALRAEIFPWYRAGVDQDTEARRVAAAMLAGEDPDGDSTDPRTFMRSVFRDGLLPAMRSDAVVLRAFFRSFNLLSTPDQLMKDTDVSARVLAAWQDRENRPAEPSLGPKRRTDLLALLPA
ncbi:MAG: FAD-dependent oxidoreductase, partial [Actinomycetota bacterium]|nr:FAD-dependent oxidoreductase [Actinomycetota bacterium]